MEFKKVEVDFPKQFAEIRALLNQMYTFYTNKLRAKNFLSGHDNKIILLNLQKKLQSQIARNLKNWGVYAAVSDCAQAIKISHALELLETQTLNSFSKYIKNLYNQAAKQQSKGVVNLVKKPEFTLIFSMANELLKKKIEHPKIEKLVEIIRAQKEGHKKIIFSQFRDTASIISKTINKIPGIKSKLFVGQAKKDDTGLTQKEQKKIIEEFKEGKINILCATSIGEEGLDIPEVNSVIFYEPVSSAIRSIQRRGRTARLSRGELIILLTKDTKDQRSYFASRSREKRMSKSIEKIQKHLKSNGKITSIEHQRTL